MTWLARSTLLPLSGEQDTSVVEKRRSLQAKKRRLLKGLETLMRMAPDLVAERPGGATGDDWEGVDGYGDSTHMSRHGSGRWVSYGEGRWVVVG